MSEDAASAPGALPGPDGLGRCPWALGSADYLAYHDQEWGRPVRDDAGMFERLSLEAFQSGLSWLRETVAGQDKVSAADLDLLSVADDPDEVVRIITTAHGNRTDGDPAGPSIKQSAPFGV